MTELNFLLFRDATAPIADNYPMGWTVIGGEPRVTNLRLYQDNDAKRFSGIWACTVGSFSVDYSGWEFVHLLRGHCRIIHESGRTFDCRAGDAFVLEPGFRGEWHVLEDIEKHFVIQA